MQKTYFRGEFNTITTEKERLNEIYLNRTDNRSLTVNPELSAVPVNIE